MDTRDLPKIIVLMVFIGMLTAVGIITLGSLGDASRAQTTVGNEQITVLTDTAVSLANDELVSFTALINATSGATISASDYSVALAAGTVTLTGAAGYNNTAVNASYIHYTDIDATTAMDNVNTAISAIPSTWLTLIITVIALAIILTLVITSFKSR